VAKHVGELLDLQRRRAFVGRAQELAAFDEALAGRSPCRLLLVHGPGGIGKTTLLHELRARARAVGRTVVLLDGRDIDPSPEGFESAVVAAVPGHGRAADGLAHAVLLVDEYEQLAPIDSWLRNEFMPTLPAEDIVVLAGRAAPAAAWRVDPGWRPLVAVNRLDPFGPGDSDRLLALAGVPAADRDNLVTLGRGHPLALSLLADVARTGVVPRSLADVPALVSTLLDSLLREVPMRTYVDGLAVCATAWLTTEDLLATVLGKDDAGEVWAWLAQRPFIVSGPRGLVPHELVRDVLDAELERRSPERYRSLHQAIHDHVIAGLRSAKGPDRLLHAQHLMYLHRRAPFTAAVQELRAQGSTAVVPARPSEHAEVLAMIERFEGTANADLAAAWLAEQPDGLSVVRREDGVCGFAYHLFTPTGSALEERDPVCRAVLDHVAAVGPTRPGERVNIARFFGGRDLHQRDLYAVLAGPVSSIVEWVTRPLAWTCVIVSDVEVWGPIFDYLGFGQLVEIEVAGERYAGFGVDWRRLPVDAWLDLMNEREHSGGTGPPPASLLRQPPLDRTTFAAAVRAALSDLRRADRLTTNPLTSSSLADGPASLRTTIEAAIESLREEPKGGQLTAVLQRTFVHGAPTQEAAAEVLGLPFSTYRRHLAKGIEELTDLLWAVEIGEVHLAARMGTD
jgi:hypothetical protein